MHSVLEDDWIHDTKGKGQYIIEKNDLFDSVWELVDTWTPEVGQEIYIAFLETLTMKFILPISNLGESTKKRISIYDIMWEKWTIFQLFFYYFLLYRNLLILYFSKN